MDATTQDSRIRFDAGPQVFFSEGVVAVTVP